MFNGLWKYIVRYVARRKGFIDPIAMFARISAIGQPAETAAPIELLRAGAVLHARGFMNNNVIQHNLDWVWPFWIERQFDPGHPSFIPRSFSMTHINITQRNWTAVGFPGCEETPVVDARGLVMPFFDSWSLEGWFVPDSGEVLLPSRSGDTIQVLEWTPNLRVVTTTELEGSRLVSCAEVLRAGEGAVLRVTLRLTAARAGWLAACVRPYNAEGVSFVNEIALLPEETGWKINGKEAVRFSRPADRHLLSNYHDGDVFLALRRKHGEPTKEAKGAVSCAVGMATGAALYRLEGRAEAEIFLEVPLGGTETGPGANAAWSTALEESAAFSGPERYEFLYQAALHTTVLLSPREIYAGPYTYKRFWYRDAAIILHALMCAGHRRIAETALDYFVAGQTLTGYFKSQEGEWDSNGQVLWALGRYCRLFNEKPKPSWVPAIRKAVHWIARKRGETKPGKGQARPHAGLLPAGFSAEHFGPNDHYYWDDFWTVGGLRLAEEMLRGTGDPQTADLAAREAGELSDALDKSLLHTTQELGTFAMPVSPYRRLDSANVGSLAAGFPLQLWPASDARLTGTVDYLCENCLIHDAFYHDISHSGINAYLTLHIAQCLLRAGDPRFGRLLNGVANLASSTGMWPEAIHPQLRTGCMGDGQHAWAAAEWIMMMRNCFVFEEEFENRLVVGAGLSADWCAPGKPARFGPAPTRFGPVAVSLEIRGEDLELTWSAEWFGAQPEIEVRLDVAGWEKVRAEPDRHSYRKAGGA